MRNIDDPGALGVTACVRSLDPSGAYINLEKHGTARESFECTHPRARYSKDRRKVCRANYPVQRKNNCRVQRNAPAMKRQLATGVQNVLNGLELFERLERLLRQAADTARSCGLFPSLWPPLDVTTTVSPHVQIEPSVDFAEGLKIKTMFSRSATSS